jgi:FtsZ-interacting cell division protein ZipA
VSKNLGMSDMAMQYFRAKERMFSDEAYSVRSNVEVASKKDIGRDVTGFWSEVDLTFSGLQATSSAVSAYKHVIKTSIKAHEQQRGLTYLSGHIQPPQHLLLEFRTDVADDEESEADVAEISKPSPKKKPASAKTNTSKTASKAKEVKSKKRKVTCHVHIHACVNACEHRRHRQRTDRTRQNHQRSRRSRGRYCSFTNHMPSSPVTDYENTQAVSSAQKQSEGEEQQESESEEVEVMEVKTAKGTQAKHTKDKNKKTSQKKRKEVMHKFVLYGLVQGT